MPKSLLVWFPSFRPHVAGNTGKLPCPDRPRDIPRLCISELIHFPELLYTSLQQPDIRKEGGWVGGLYVRIDL